MKRIGYFIFKGLCKLLDIFFNAIKYILKAIEVIDVWLCQKLGHHWRGMYNAYKYCKYCGMCYMEYTRLNSKGEQPE